MWAQILFAGPIFWDPQARTDYYVEDSDLGFAVKNRSTARPLTYHASELVKRVPAENAAAFCKLAKSIAAQDASRLVKSGYLHDAKTIRSAHNISPIGAWVGDSLRLAKRNSLKCGRVNTVGKQFCSSSCIKHSYESAGGVMKKQIGLLTLPLHSNYGGILQIAALRQYLEDAGHTTVLMERDYKGPLKNQIVMWAAEIIPPAFLKGTNPAKVKGENGGVRGKIERFMARIKQRQLRGTHAAFIEQCFKMRTGVIYSSDGMRQAVADFNLDAVIVGSDQVWRLRYLPDDGVADYFLGFADRPDMRRISYAASFGNSEWIYHDETEMVSKLLADFSAVSVREKTGVEICRDDLGRDDAELVLDPTMLVDEAFYDTVMSPSPTGRPQGGLLTYVLDFDSDHPDLAASVARRLGPDCAVHSLALEGRQKLVGVPEWLRAFKDARWVLTDSFHGTVFSILFRKDFIAIVNKKRGSDRFVSLLSQLGLQDRLVDSDGIEAIAEKMAQPVDYAAVDEKLSALRDHSMQFLKKALD
nr:polysaccharide pyruvyl transferase family protein [Marinicella sp. W31]MDC2875959.1 polysaccharide pyruvyl transferase family protein [Marinicella sp. W31]